MSIRVRSFEFVWLVQNDDSIHTVSTSAPAASISRARVTVRATSSNTLIFTNTAVPKGLSRATMLRTIFKSSSRCIRGEKRL